MEDPLLTDQQIENGIDWTPMAVSARAMTPHAVRAFYEAQITKDRALIQALVNALDKCTIDKPDIDGTEFQATALSTAKEQGFTPTEG